MFYGRQEQLLAACGGLIQELMDVALVSVQTAWDEGAEGNLAEKDLADGELNMTQECTLAVHEGNPVMGLHRKKCGQVKEVILALFSYDTPPGVLHPDLESSVQERHGPVEVGLEKGHKNDLRAAFL